MRGLTEEAATVGIDVATRVLHLPTVRAAADELAAAAVRDRVTHRAYLAELLAAEVEDRESRRRERRIVEARFPRIKRLADFDLGATPTIAPGTLAALATCNWIGEGEPVVLLGDSGTGKTHLLIGLGIAACEQGHRVRYVTAAALVNELVEAEDERELSKVVGRYGRLDLLCLDELGYLHLDRRGAANDGVGFGGGGAADGVVALAAVYGDPDAVGQTGLAGGIEPERVAQDEVVRGPVAVEL